MLPTLKGLSIALGLAAFLVACGGSKKSGTPAGGSAAGTAGKPAVSKAADAAMRRKYEWATLTPEAGCCAGVAKPLCRPSQCWAGPVRSPRRPILLFWDAVNLRCDLHYMLRLKL